MVERVHARSSSLAVAAKPASQAKGRGFDPRRPLSRIAGVFPIPHRSTDHRARPMSVLCQLRSRKGAASCGHRHAAPCRMIARSGSSKSSGRANLDSSTPTGAPGWLSIVSNSGRSWQELRRCHSCRKGRTRWPKTLSVRLNQAVHGGVRQCVRQYTGFLLPTVPSSVCPIYTRMVGSSVRSFWFGESLSPIEHLCVKSFLAQGHRFLLYTYDEVENVPDGCELLDAATVLDEGPGLPLRGSGSRRQPRRFFDLFRYTLLDRDGGWWVDTDTLCLTAEIPEPEYVFAKSDVLLRQRDHAGSGGEFSDSGNAHKGAAHRRRAGWQLEFGSIGPHLLTEVVRDLDFAHKATDTAALYPIPYRQALATCDRVATSKSSGGLPRAHSSTCGRRCSGTGAYRKPPGRRSAHISRPCMTLRHLGAN